MAVSERRAVEVGRLAYHALRGEEWEKAVTYYREAGTRAAQASSAEEAVAAFEQSLVALARLPETPSTLEQGFEIRVELRASLSVLGEIRRVLERLGEAEALAERLNDDRRRGQVCALVTNVHSQLGALDEAVATGTRALEIATRLGDVKLRVPAAIYLSQAYYYRGEYEQVVQVAADGLAALPGEWASEFLGLYAVASVNAGFWLVLGLAQLGRFAEAAACEAQAIELAESAQHAISVAGVHYAAGLRHVLAGDWAEAHRRLDHAIAMYRTAGVVINLPNVMASSAWVLAQLGQSGEALDRLREGEDLLERETARGIVAHHGWGYQALGRACLLLGRLDEARRLGDRALDTSPDHPGFAAHALHLLGDIATHPDRIDAGRGKAYYRRALALAEPRRMRPLVAHCHFGLAELYAKTGKPAEACTELTAAADLYRSMGMTFWLARAEARLEPVR